MAFVQCDFFSDVLGLSCSMNVLLPQPTAAQIGLKGRGGRGPHPTLWLLHGASDDHTIWMRRTSIERYVSELGLAVVMPAANLSYYVNMAAGPQYGTFFEDELPAIARSFFPLSDRRADNFVAGLSMGGYGAFRLALTHPDRYAAAASLSGVLDVASPEFLREAPRNTRMEAALGKPETVRDSPHDLLHLAGNLAKSKRPRPALYACCGTEDFLLDQNRTFARHARELALPLTYEESPGGHEWAYWDRAIQRVLEWLPLASACSRGQ